MKKNVMMRVASIMLVLVLMSSSVISGTFAKYVTNGSGSDFARVAKFGVEVKAFDGMFSHTYVTHDTTLSAEEAAIVGADSVVTSNGQKLVAPGTSGKMTEIQITGTPEVAVRVNYEVTNIELTGWEVGGAYYCPIIINVCGTYLDGKDYDSVDKFIEAIEGAVAGYTKVYAANTNLEDKQAENMDITWEWPFQNDTGAKYDQDDLKDTELGDNAADGVPATINLTVTCTVTQID